MAYRRCAMCNEEMYAEPNEVLTYECEVFYLCSKCAWLLKEIVDKNDKEEEIK